MSLTTLHGHHELGDAARSWRDALLAGLAFALFFGTVTALVLAAAVHVLV